MQESEEVILENELYKHGLTLNSFELDSFYGILIVENSITSTEEYYTRMKLSKYLKKKNHINAYSILDWIRAFIMMKNHNNPDGWRY